MGLLSHLKISLYYAESFRNECKPEAQGRRLMADYIRKIDWILKDVITNPHFPPDAIEEIKKEIESDVLSIPAINDKLNMMDDERRAHAEKVLNIISGGGKILIVEDH